MPPDPAKPEPKEEFDEEAAKAAMLALVQGFLSVLSDALKGVTVVFGDGDETRKTAIFLLEEARKAPFWTEDETKDFTNNVYLRAFPEALRERIISAVLRVAGTARDDPDGKEAEYDLIPLFKGISLETVDFAAVGARLEAEVIAYTGDARSAGEEDLAALWNAGRGAWTTIPLPGPWAAVALLIATFADAGASGSGSQAFRELFTKVAAGRLTKGLVKTGKYDFGTQLIKILERRGIVVNSKLLESIGKWADKKIHDVMQESFERAIDDVFGLIDVLSGRQTDD